MRIWICEEFLKMRDILTYVHADEQESGRKGKTEGTYHYRKGKSMLKVSDTEWCVGIWSTGEGTDSIKRASPFPPIKRKHGETGPKQVYTGWRRWERSNKMLSLFLKVRFERHGWVGSEPVLYTINIFQVLRW